MKDMVVMQVPDEVRAKERVCTVSKPGFEA